MRCEDLTRELASPTGTISPAEMAGHLAACPVCAEWSRQAARFDQIWEATRPVEPTPPMMDALWASASVALEARSVPATLRFEGVTSARRRSWLKPAMVLAQVAMLLLAAGIFLVRKGPVEPIPVVAHENPIPVVVNQPVDDLDLNEIPTWHVNEGETLVVWIPIDKTATAKAQFLPETHKDNSNVIPLGTQHDLFNEMEVTGTTVASR